MAVEGGAVEIGRGGDEKELGEGVKGWDGFGNHF